MEKSIGTEAERRDFPLRFSVIMLMEETPI